jgi:hypothetical protein
MTLSRRDRDDTAARRAPFSGTGARRSRAGPGARQGALCALGSSPEHKLGAFAGAGQRLRVVEIVAFDEEDESPFVGLLQVEAARGSS